MPVTLERQKSYSLIRLEGECTVTSAAELKSALIEGLAEGKDLRLDLEPAEEIDITTLQLLWAVGRAAERAGAAVSVRLSGAAERAARDAGFQTFPGLPL